MQTNILYVFDILNTVNYNRIQKIENAKRFLLQNQDEILLSQERKMGNKDSRTFKINSEIEMIKVQFMKMKRIHFRREQGEERLITHI